MSELFQPSLAAGSRGAKPLYSNRATFLTSFFGGPPAALLILGENARRLGTLPRDAAILLAGIVLWVGLFVWYFGNRQAEGALSSTTFRYVVRGLSLLIWGAVSWLHREEQRATDLMGVDRPNGWWLGLAAIAFGIGATLGLGVLYVLVTGAE